MFIGKNPNKRFELNDGPNRSKTRLETHLRFFKEKPIDTMAVYTLSAKKMINVKFPQINVKFPRIITKIEKNRISPFLSYDSLRAGRENLKPTLERVYKES